MRNIDNVNNNPHNDEIDLIDLLVGIWNGKWIIIFTTIITTLAGLAYYYYSPTKYQESINLRPLSTQEATWLDEMSNLPGVSLDINSISTTYANYISDENIIEKFINQFVANKNSDNNKQSGANFNIKAKIEKEQQSLTNIRKLSTITLRFSSDSISKQQFTDYIINFLDFAKQGSRELLLAFIKSKQDLHRLNIAQQIEQIEEKKKLALSLYQAQLNAEIILLNEKISEIRAKAKTYLNKRISNLKVNIAIANKLGLERPGQNPEVEIENISILNTIESNNAPLFMRGYIALEEELKSIENISLEDFSQELRGLIIKKEILENRTETAAFVPEIINLNNKLLELENDIVGARFKEFFTKENLASFSPEFIKVNTSFDNPNFIKKTSPTIMIIALSIIAGLFLGLFLVLFLNLIRSVKEKLTSKL